MAIRLRELTEQERAQIIRLAAGGRAAPEIGQRLGLNPQTARDWIVRFNAEGLPGLDDRPRPGKPPTYTPEQTGEPVMPSL